MPSNFRTKARRTTTKNFRNRRATARNASRTAGRTSSGRTWGTRSVSKSGSATKRTGARRAKTSAKSFSKNGSFTTKGGTPRSKPGTARRGRSTRRKFNSSGFTRAATNKANAFGKNPFNKNKTATFTFEGTPGTRAMNASWAKFAKRVLRSAFGAKAANFTFPGPNSTWKNRASRGGGPGLKFRRTGTKARATLNTGFTFRRGSSRRAA
jgi:hypothetical protein